MDTLLKRLACNRHTSIAAILLQRQFAAAPTPGLVVGPRGGTGATCALPAPRSSPLRNRAESRDKISLYRKRKVVFPDDNDDGWGRAAVTIVTTIGE
jgi:hypothetical protein